MQFQVGSAGSFTSM